METPAFDEQLLDLPDAMHATPAMAAVFSGPSRVQRMLDFEAALARAQARAGLIPDEAATAITEAAATATLDIADLSRRSAVAGTIAVPLVAALRDHVVDDARRYVHFGATSQDVIDTAVMLQVRDGLRILIADLVGIGSACAALCRRYRDTPMVGRTLLQQAVPVTFGLKAAGWLAGVTRMLERLHRLHDEDLALQFGGAAGTLASLGSDGVRVTELLADELGLPAPAMPWHTERSRIADIAAALATTAGVMSKIAMDVVLMMQTEVAEAAEASEPGKGQSSAMPQKRNPVDTMAALASARLASASATVILTGMAQEHERAVGAWQAEWTAIPNLFQVTASAVARIRTTVHGLTIDVDRMRANLQAGGGQAMAESLATTLAGHIGKPDAYTLVAALSRHAVSTGDDIRAAASADERVRSLLGQAEIDAALDPAGYLGSAGGFVDRVLETFVTALDAGIPGVAEGPEPGMSSGTSGAAISRRGVDTEAPGRDNEAEG